MRSELPSSCTLVRNFWIVGISLSESQSRVAGMQVVDHLKNAAKIGTCRHHIINFWVCVMISIDLDELEIKIKSLKQDRHMYISD